MTNSISIQKKFLISFAIAILFIFQFFVFGPSTIYFTNFNEFSFSYSDFILNLMPTMFIYILCLAILFIVIPQKYKLFRLFFTATILFLFMVWLQGTFLVWNYGVLNGEPIQWDNFRPRLIIELLVYFVFSFIFYYFRRKLVKHSLIIIGFLFAVQLIGIGSSFYRLDSEAIDSNKIYSISHDHAYDFSRTKNVVVMILDSFDTPLFKEFLKEHSDYKNILDGFAYFSNTMSAYPTTFASVPNILTSKLYRNREPFNVFLKKAYQSGDSLFRVMKNRHYKVETYSERREVYLNPNLQDNVVARHFDFDDRLFRASVFRQMPQCLKELYYEKFWSTTLKYLLIKFTRPSKSTHPLNENRWKKVIYPFDYAKYDDKNNVMPKYEFDQLFSLKSSSPVFKFFHYPGPHPFNRNFTLAKNRYDSAVHCMEIVSAMIAKLKESSVYDKSVIVILGDHGPYNQKISARNFNPILLVKPLDSRGKILEFNAPLMLGDVPKLVSNSLEKKNKPLKNLLNGIINGDVKKRNCYHYTWADSWERSYLPPMTELNCQGNIQNVELKPTGIIFSNKGNKDRTCTVDELIDFSEKESEKYIINGWEISPEGLVLKGNAIRKSLCFYLKDWSIIDSSIKMVVHYTKASKEEDQSNTVIRINEWVSHKVPVLKNRGDKGVFEIIIPEHLLIKDYGELYVRFLGNVVISIQNIQFRTFANGFMLGDTVSFNKHGQSQLYCGQGWSGQESTIRWTDGREAELKLRLNEYNNKDLMLRLYGSGYLAAGKIDRQEVIVTVNNHEVAKWDVGQMKWYEARIPSYLIKDDHRLNIVFKISDPSSPFEYGLSSDDRKLGVAAMYLRIEYYRQRLKNSPMSMIKKYTPAGSIRNF